MTVIVNGVKRVFRRDRDQVIYECRRCGTTVDHDTDHCPACGSAGIARYDIP